MQSLLLLLSSSPFSPWTIPQGFQGQKSETWLRVGGTLFLEELLSKCFDSTGATGTSRYWI